MIINEEVMSENVKLYIQIEKNNQVSKRDIHISDIADIFCNDKNIQARVNSIKLIKLPDVKQKRISLSIIDVIKAINRIYPDVEVDNIGESSFIIDYIREKKKNMCITWLMIAFTTVFIFVGSAYAIMAYNNDVSTNEIFEKIYKMFDTPQLMDYKLMEIMYAIGLALGIIIFYNHFGGKRLSSDPTPLEVQMDKYNTEISDAIINGRAARDNGKKSEKSISERFQYFRQN